MNSNHIPINGRSKSDPRRTEWRRDRNGTNLWRTDVIKKSSMINDQRSLKLDQAMPKSSKMILGFRNSAKGQIYGVYIYVIYKTSNINLNTINLLCNFWLGLDLLFFFEKTQKPRQPSSSFERPTSSTRVMQILMPQLFIMIKHDHTKQLASHKHSKRMIQQSSTN